MEINGMPKPANLNIFEMNEHIRNIEKHLRNVRITKRVIRVLIRNSLVRKYVVKLIDKNIAQGEILKQEVELCKQNECRAE